MQPECSAIPSYQGSLYQKLQMRISVEALSSFFEAIKPAYLYAVSGVQKEKKALSQKAFLQHYKEYLSSDEHSNKLCIAISSTPDIICWQKVSSGFIARAQEPVIHVKPFSFMIDHQGEFRAGMRGSGAMNWGLELKYPMLFMDPNTSRIEKSIKMNYSNNALFAIVRKWIRHETRPAYFEVAGTMKVSSFRRGKEDEA